MILIIGQHHDTTTDNVCNWLNCFGAKFIRTNTGTNNTDLKVNFWHLEHFVNLAA